MLIFRAVDGRELRDRRLRFGLTQQQVADWLGVSQVFVQQMETGKRPIPTQRQMDRRRPEQDAIETQLDVLFAGLAKDPDDSGIRSLIGYARRRPYQ